MGWQVCCRAENGGGATESDYISKFNITKTSRRRHSNFEQGDSPKDACIFLTVDAHVTSLDFEARQGNIHRRPKQRFCGVLRLIVFFNLLNYQQICRMTTLHWHLLASIRAPIWGQS